MTSPAAKAQPKLRVSYKERQAENAKNRPKSAPQKADLTYLPFKTEKAPKEMRPTKKGEILPFVPRIKEANEATSRENDLWQRSTYRTGDGEVLTPPRPGSMDFLKWPSRGNKT
jgi:hypothetical protein